MIKFSSAFLFIITISFIFTQTGFSQSKKDLEREYKVYKTNKVKTETIQYNDGTKTVNSYDIQGRKTEEVSYFENNQSNKTTYKYDSKGLPEEEKYFGFESGDSYTTKFTYDEAGNLIKTVSTGSLEDISEYANDEMGNPVKISYFSPTDTKSAYDFLEYKNTYANGMLTSIETKCKEGDETTFGSKFTYDGEKIILNEDYTKNCKTGAVTIGAKKTFEYSANGLIKLTKYSDTYLTEPRTGTYTYEYY
ncbi:MAG: hypothetical protein JSS63_07260 [Bacteroidetes bacterium]|nr:hypothetical protein [Bacteroidota bacterium]